VVLVAQIRNGLAFNQMLARNCDLLLSVGKQTATDSWRRRPFSRTAAVPTVFTRHTESPPKTEAAALRLGNEPIFKDCAGANPMIIGWIYDGHHCRIEEHEHEGYVVYDGYVDDDLICRNEPVESGVRRAIAMWINNATDHAMYTTIAQKA
jgi:hypothetical protein